MKDYHYLGLKPFTLIGITYGNRITPGLLQEFTGGQCRYYLISKWYNNSALKRDLGLMKNSHQIQSAKMSRDRLVSITKDCLDNEELKVYEEMKQLIETHTEYKLP